MVESQNQRPMMMPKKAKTSISKSTNRETTFLSSKLLEILRHLTVISAAYATTIKYTSRSGVRIKEE